MRQVHQKQEPRSSHLLLTSMPKNRLGKRPQREMQKVPPEVVAARARSLDGHDWCQDWRKCSDGSLHSGDLELITWDGEDSDEESELGFGGCLREESDDLKRMFEGEMGGDKMKLLEYYDSAFRWTCCGLTASGGYAAFGNESVEMD
jgi:hypothetical protein